MALRELIVERFKAVIDWRNNARFRSYVYDSASGKMVEDASDPIHPYPKFDEMTDEQLLDKFCEQSGAVTKR